MKKLILSMAVLAAFASCQKNESAEAEVQPTTAISFSTLNDRVTAKAANNNGGTSDNYQVYATTSAGSSSGWYIDEEVYGANDADDTSIVEDAIKSGKTYYWPQADPMPTVNFYAYAPMASDDLLEEGTKVYTNGSEAIPLVFTVPNDANVDFTVATPVTGASYNGTTDTPSDGTVTNGKVSLKFSHMLSKATFEVALDENLETAHLFTFTKAEFTVVENQVETDVALATATTSTIATGSTTDTYTYNFTSLATAATSFTADNALYFAPHNDAEKGANGCEITLTGVKITEATSGALVYSGDLTYTLTNATSFEQGSQYKFVVTLTSDDLLNGLEITFSSTASDWDEGENGDNDVNLSTPDTEV